MKILSNFVSWYSGNDEPKFEILNFVDLNWQHLSYLLMVNVSFLYLLPSVAPIVREAHESYMLIFIYDSKLSNKVLLFSIVKQKHYVFDS